MESVTITEARRRLSAIVSAAERGEPTVITRRGRQAARVEPVRAVRCGPVPDLPAFRASIKVKGEPLSKVVTRLRRGARY